MSLVVWVGIAATVLLLGLIIYWQLIIAEGTYLGQPIVTWMYDLVAKRYDKIKGFDPDIEAAFLGRPLAADLVRLGAGLVLDIGTGTGRLPVTLFDQPRFQGRIIGVDASEHMLRIAAEKLVACRDRCWLIHQSAMRLHFVSESFDAVTILEMLEFTPDPVAVLREAVRVLRPGGLLLVTRRTGFDAKLIPGKTYSETQFCELLTQMGIEEIRTQRWQVDYELVWGRRSGESMQRSSQLLEVLMCLRCGDPAYQWKASGLLCEACGNKVQEFDGIIKMSS